MTDPGPLAIAWRLGVAVFVIVMPTVMFFQLLRFLEWLRDDELIARVDEHNEFGTDDREGHLATVAAQSRPARAHTPGSTSSPDDRPLRRCDSCGTHNVPEATYCSGCLGGLE
jgi:hypothetical protein